MVPVGVEVKAFAVETGGVVLARRITNSQFARAEAAAAGSSMLLAEYIFRQAVVGCEGLTLEGKAVEFSRGRDAGAPQIAAMCASAVFDAVPMALAAEVVAWAVPGASSGVTAGNSPAPPGPSSA